MKYLKYIGLLFVALLIIGAVIFYPKYKQGMKIKEALDVANIANTFLKMDAYFPAKEVLKSEQSYVFLDGKDMKLPEVFSYKKHVFETKDYLDSTGTQGLVVLKNDSLVFENYTHGQEKDTRHISWSMAKSFISALFGIAIEEGHIKSIDQKVEEYLPELKGSGYEGVRIKDVLQMSTGVKFNEDYADPNSDINRWMLTFALGESQDEFAATLVRERAPGTLNHYVSINTHVLGMILVKATGKSLTEYLQEKIWQKIGMENNAYWVADDKNMEMALGGLNATTRDYAKMGQLYLHEGNWRGEQIVPKDWLKASITPDAPHLMPKDGNFGYGYQWWIPDGDEGEFMAIGVFHQFIYVNPTKNVVIAKNSANPYYLEMGSLYSNELVSLELFRKIARGLDKKEE